MCRLQSTRRPALVLAVVAGVLAVSGCQAFQPLASRGPTQSDRLMQAYPDLRSGRFAVIADFESPVHMQLVHCIDQSPKAQCRLRRTGGRSETGRRCVEFVAGSSEDAVVLNNAGAEGWSLTRDWRPYDLLLLNVAAPEPGLKAIVQVAAGSLEKRLSVESTIPLTEGWNVLRLDLEEIAEHLPLDDMQEIRLSVGNLDRPARLQIDDIVLTGNRRDLFGNSGNADGRLYLQQVGRRWRVGAGGRFELTFANGQIVAWHNLAGDPYRLQNLVQGTTLGPCPLVIGETDSNEELPEIGESVVVHPQVLEINRVRAVISSEWRGAGGRADALDGPPNQRWIYTIYPTGQVYAVVEYSTSTPRFSGGRTGLAVTLAIPDRGDLETYLTPSAEPSGTDAPFAMARNPAGDACALYVPAHDDEAPLGWMQQADDDQRRLSLIAVREGEPQGKESWQCHVVLASADELSDEEAQARAAGFHHPAAPDLQLGSLVERSGSRPNPNGFDRASGCYVISPDRGRVRLTLDGRRRPLFYPAFRIVNTEGRAAQVYADHIVLDDFAFTREGDLVFQVPRIVSDQVVVEVFFRRR